MSAVIVLVNVKKDFGYIKALKGITLSIKKGEKVSLLGPNGAGKSTLLRIIAAQMVPSSGIVKVLDYDALTQREKIKRRIGVVGHRSFLYDELTVMENLKFYGSFLGSTQDEYENMIKVTVLEKWRDVKARNLSYGLRKRGDIARALLGEPDILLLDEFFAGLDHETSVSLTMYLKEMKGRSILLSSHSTELVEFCDRSVYLRNGIIEKDVRVK